MVTQTAQFLCNAGLTAVKMSAACSVIGDAHLTAAVTAQHRTVLQKQDFHALSCCSNGSRTTGRATAGNDQIVITALFDTEIHALDPSPVCMDPVDLTGGQIVHIRGQNNGSTAGKIAGQVVKRKLMGTLFQLHIAGNFPKPLIRGQLAEDIARLLAIHQDRKLAGIVGAEPVAVTHPNAVHAAFGDLHLHGGILHRYTGLVCGNQIAAAHQVDILRVLLPAALFLEV